MARHKDVKKLLPEKRSLGKQQILTYAALVLSISSLMISLYLLRGG
jgi:hypothetical protein